MKRLIIKIDRELCNGCGNCVTGCAEGAIQIIEGKAQLVKEQFCDGMGACIGTCPTGALTLEEREADAYDEQATNEHLKQIGRKTLPHNPPQTPPPFSKPVGGHIHTHGHGFQGCPGSAARNLKNTQNAEVATSTQGLPAKINNSELAQWPVQLHLVPVKADFFQDKELVVMSTCGPIASADVHWRFLRGRAVVVACPKLDRTDNYVEKLAAIFASNNIKKIITVRMTVPCCRGLTMMVEEAIAQSGVSIPHEETVMDLDGSIK